MAMSSIDRDKLLNEYRKDINIMLQALGCNSRTIAALMKKYQEDILRWFGNTNKSPIVTAAWAARLILREELGKEICDNSSFTDLNSSKI